MLALVLSGCGTGLWPGGGDASPPYAVDGLSAAGSPADPGEPVVIGIPVALHSGSVTLESAILEPLPGFPVPSMTHIGAVTSRDWITSAAGWPPRNPPGNQDRGKDTGTLLPLPGYVLTAGHPVALYYAITGSKPGTAYYAEGIRLTYRKNGREYAVTLYQAGIDCVGTGPPARMPPCSPSQTASNEIGTLPHS